MAAACAGVFAGGVVLAVTQSFLTSVGSPATAPFWLCAFLLAALCAGGLFGVWAILFAETGLLLGFFLPVYAQHRSGPEVIGTVRDGVPSGFHGRSSRR